MAEKSFFVDLQLNQNQLLQAVLQNAASDPLTPVAGQVYFNTGDNTAYVYNGSAWIAWSVQLDDALTFEGGIDCSTNPDYPAADTGHLYKVTVAGKVGGAAGVDVEVGDTLICTVDSSAAGDHATVGANWIILQTNIDYATTTVAGFVRLATQAEVDAGTETDAVVTPATLASANANFTHAETITASTGATVLQATHGLTTVVDVTFLDDGTPKKNPVIQWDVNAGGDVIWSVNGSGVTGTLYITGLKV